jgi:phospholipase C
MMKTNLLSTVAMSVIAAAVVGSGPVLADQHGDRRHDGDHHIARTATPIKHLVVIFNEIPFNAKPHTPKANNLANANLLTNNPNFTNTANGSDAAEPFRLDRTQANTADQNHAYTAEEQAYDNGKADLFPEYTGKGTSGGVGAFGTKGQVMGYFDGNTTTALWNYAQHSKWYRARPTA